MPRANKDGKFIISAGEVGQYAVCPEAWRLKMIEKVMAEQSELSAEGQRLHDEWSKRVDDAAHLGQGLRFLAALLVSTILIILLY